MCPGHILLLAYTGNPFADVVDLVDLFIGNHFGDTFHAACCVFDGYAESRGLILDRTLLFSLLSDTRSIVFRSQWAGLGEKGPDLPDTDSRVDQLGGLAFSFFLLA